MDDELIRVCALAVRAACPLVTAQYLKALRDSVDQTCSLPAKFDWDRKATAHAQIIGLLTEAVGDPVLALLTGSAPGWLHDLMISVGPTAAGTIAASRRRLLALICAGNAEGAAREMEQHLRGLLWMRKVSRAAALSDIAS